MASKKTKAAAATADDNLDELFEGINDSKAKKPTGTTTRSKGTSSSKTKGDDPLADLESQLAAEQAPTSRPHTPRLKEARRSTATPPAAADDKSASHPVRQSTDSARSLKATFTPSATSSELYESEKKGTVEQAQQAQEGSSAGGGGGGWWGGWISTATATANAAMKQAEAAYKEIQQHEEAKKWAEQVKGLKDIDVGTLRTYGDELRQRALPTFTNILHTLAPPISSHERLLIHISHDLVGYPSLDPLIHTVFARVMSQVEGGDLLVVQRGQENSSRRSNDGWHDGPWWRQIDSPRELGLVKGLVEGTKLCRAGAESYSSEYFAAHGGVEEAKLRATQAASESNPVRTSDLFLSVQAISTDADKALFASSASAEKEKEESAVQDQPEADELICFAVFILDPVHEIEYSTVSQSIPARWVRWLDAPTPLTPRSADNEGQEAAPELSDLPDEIRDIVESGGVDPREWVAEWIEDVLSLSVGVVAQRYVARRMGVGEGGLGRGKKKLEELVNENAGEAARAGLL